MIVMLYIARSGIIWYPCVRVIKIDRMESGIPVLESNPVHIVSIKV